MVQRTGFAHRWSVGVLVAITVTCFPHAQAQADGSRYLDEPIYDTRVFPDEAAVNVGVAFNRWPDCTTLESAIGDIFRLEGVSDAPGQHKALALWKWFRVLVSATGGSYAYEGPRGNQRLCADPHKIFAVYGHHQCDGQSWAMVGLWRAAGMMAFDECTWGHTTAALRYRDADGQYRYHSFDPQRRYYHWDEKNGRVSTRSMPVMSGMVYRHITAPRELHSLRTSLRIGETIDRLWDNAGHVVPSGKDKIEAETSSYYAYKPGKTNGVYAAVGEEVQTYRPSTNEATFGRCLAPSSQNTACSAPAEGKATLHPRTAGETAAFVYRMAPPYVVADARCEATLVKTRPDDVCRLSISRDGEKWHPVYEKQTVGQEHVAVDFGHDAWKQGRPNVFSAYDVYVKAEFQTAGQVRGVGMNDLTIVANRMLNKRTLPNLRPGKNVVRVTADRIERGWALRVAIAWRVEDRPREEVRFVRRFPCYFKIGVPEVPEAVHDNYDQRFNDGPLRMTAIRMRLVPDSAVPGDRPPVLRADEGEKAFAIASPHPAGMVNRHPAERPERDVRETNGFFPQSDVRLDDDARMKSLIDDLNSGDAAKQWAAAEALGNYPKAVEALVAKLPGADIDLTLFICKSLSQIGDRRAVGPLLEKWKRAPRGAPGTRYIPDALAAIGDPSVVPALIEPLPRCRFDYRFHVAHALGILGGPAAEEALEDLAANDPFPAVREQAKMALGSLRGPK